LQRTIAKHEHTLDENNPRDFIDTYLIEMKKHNTDGNSIFTGKPTYFKNCNLKCCCNPVNVVLEVFIVINTTDQHLRVFLIVGNAFSKSNVRSDSDIERGKVRMCPCYVIPRYIWRDNENG
jgi:hypothetical protein